MEQSLINGLWGSFPHDVIAIASTFIARFEMKSMDQVRWKRKKSREDTVQIMSSYHPDFNKYKILNSSLLKNCILQIYSKVYEGAVFPFDSEIGDELQMFKRRNNREASHILIS